MSQSRRRRAAGRNPQKQKSKLVRHDLWRPVPSLPPPEPIVPSPEPSALIRSLGDPPLQGQGKVAEHYMAAVVDSAANLARALAAASALLGGRPGDDD